MIVWEIGKSLIEIKSPARNYRLVRRCAGIAAATYLASPRMLALTNLASSGLIQINLALSALAMLAPRLDPNAAYGQYVRRTPRISAAGDGGRAGAWYRAISGKDLAAMNTAKKSSGTDGTGHELGDETFISAEQLRDYTNALMAAKASDAVEAIDRRDEAKRNLIKTLSTLLDLTPEKLKEITKPLLFKLRKAAERGETELMVMRFPHDLCSDKGRAINNAEAGWPDTLTGRPRQAFELWRDELQPAGYRLTASVVDWPGGLPGDIGLFLSWGARSGG